MDRRFEKLSFDRERRTWTVETTCGNGTSETFQARHVVSSPPIPELLSDIPMFQDVQGRPIATLIQKGFLDFLCKAVQGWPRIASVRN